MIPNHEQFLAAIADQKKVIVRFYSKADSGVLDRICAPMSYGPVSEPADGLNRFRFWDYASVTGKHTLELLPLQIIELSVLGENFDASVFAREPAVVTSTQEP
jgi:hypothetical protein